MGLGRKGPLASGSLPLSGRVGRLASDGGGTLPSDDPTIGFTGDVMLGRGVDRVHRDGAPGDVWGGLHDRLRALDGVVANLECVLSERGEPWPDKKFHFRASPSWAPAALRAGNVSAVALGNNHAMDFGAPALLDTVEHLDAAGIAHAGAGATLDAALEPARFRIGDLDVAMVSFVDHWGDFAAGPDSAGTAWAELDPTDEETRRLATDALDRARASNPDLLVASLHWGYNYETRSTDAHRRFARFLVERGVDVVHGHSAHILQGVEVLDGVPVIHDAGEFVDDYADHERYHNDRSYLFELVLGDPPHLRLVPIEISDYRVHRASQSTAAALEQTVRDRSDGFGTTFEPGAETGTLRVPLE